VANAGLALGDRVIAIDGVAIVSQADMVARLGAAGERITLDVDRRGRILQLETTER
jgi:predicted metalloprotease with PDZ domain